MIHKTKVVTRNIIHDFIAKIQNVLGLNLTSYEKMLNNALDQINEEISKEGIKLKWYRLEISQLTGSAMVVILYGEEKMDKSV